jgi:hypothetical protein
VFGGELLTKYENIQSFAVVLGCGVFGSAFCGCHSVTTLEYGKVRAADYAGEPAVDYQIAVSGKKGLKFAGTIVTDGVKQDVSGVVPESYRVTEHEVVCKLKKSDEPGDLVLSVLEGTQTTGSCSTSEAKSGVRGWVVRSKGLQMNMFTTVEEK